MCEMCPMCEMCTKYLFVFSPNAGKYGPEKTPYLDTFHAVVIKLMRMRKLTLEGKITIFKSLAISEIVHLAIITKVPNIVIEKLKNFLWDNKTVKIK